MRTCLWIAVLGLALGSAPGQTAPPQIPETVSYQGVLLDSGGLPRTGTVDLILRIYDAAASGTLVYKQEFASVTLTDGVFSIELGPAGSSADTSTDPLTTDLATALAGDAGVAAPERFIEVTVGAEGALVRTQILTVPYAFRASHADTADATDTADLALDVTTVGGLPATVLTQIFDHTNLDDEGELNGGPTEGFGDADGNGVPNYLDPDNDGDGFLDGQEIADGDDPNLPTPLIASVDPAQAFTFFPTSVTVQGQNFEPGLTLLLGAQTPIAEDVTATSFRFDLTGGPLGTVGLVVTLPNGESDNDVFTFLASSPHGLNIGPLTQSSIAATASNFVIGADDEYGVNLASPTPFPSEGGIAISWSGSGALAGLRCRSSGAGECTVELTVDSDADFELGDETPTAIEVITGTAPAIGSPSLTFDASGRPAAGYLRSEDAATVSAVVAHDRDGSGDFSGTNELVTIESVSALTSNQGKVAVDSAGQVAFIYGADPLTSAARVARDRNGDGDFADVVGSNPELLDYPGSGFGTLGCIAVAFDASDRLWAIRNRDTGGLIRKIDLNDDGDFEDLQESISLTGTPGGCDIANANGVIHILHAADGVHLLRDLNGDLDFADADEDEASIAGTFGVLGLAADVGNGASIFFADDQAGLIVP